MAESLTGLDIGQERFLFSLAFAYVLALIQRFLLVGRSSSVQNVYAVAVGGLVYYYNFGAEIMHPLAMVTSTWLLLKLLTGRVSIKIINFVAFFLNFGYLLGAYWFHSTDDYDLNWTTPHCVLTLRLIGLAYDVTDGTKDAKTLDAVQKERALAAVPGYLDVLGFSFHYAGLMIGPQFPFALYDRYLKGTLLLDPSSGKPIAIDSLPMPVLPALKALFVGLLYLAITQVGGAIIPASKILDTDWMLSQTLAWRLVWVMLWGRIQMMTYLGLWKFSEGAGILSGFGAQINPQTKQLAWDRLSNVRLLHYETATNTREVVGAFNINTNAWCQQYVQKRLIPLFEQVLKKETAKLFADLSTLMFLAIWHGFHLGYFIAFATEWVTLEAEKRVMGWTNPIKNRIYGVPKDERRIQFDPHGGGFVGYTYSLVGYFVRSLAIAFGMVPFALFKVPKIIQVWGSIYYLPLLICFAIIAVDTLLKTFRSKPKRT